MRLEVSRRVSSRSLRKLKEPTMKTISNMFRADIKEMFEFPLRRTYELLLEQILQARRTGKVKLKVR